MPVTRPKIEDPCQNCRDRHARCDENRPRCKQCERVGEECIRVSSRLKFKHGSSAKYDKTFKKDQTWLEQSKHVKIQFIDQTPELENYYAIDPETDDDATPAHNRNDADSSAGPPLSDKRRAVEETFRDSPKQQVALGDEGQTGSSVADYTNPPAIASNQKRQRVGESGSQSYPLPPLLGSPLDFQTFQSPAVHSDVSIDAILNRVDQSPHLSTPTSLTRAVEAEYRRLADTAAAAIPSASSGLLSPDVWKKKFFWPNAWTTTQCACLMRYYVEELAPWLDVCDPAQHFTTVVPQRARRCPPLLNAIFTTAARHLFRVSKYKTTDGFVRYQGVTLRNLTSETAINYHNACLAYLIELSADERHVTDENLLAASVILRYYEELDSSLTGQDPETFLHTFQIFTNAQANSTTTAPPFPSTAAHNQSTYPNSSSQLHPTWTTDFTSFRHASFRIALRQEITSAFMKQRPLRLPLQAWSSLRSFSDADDAVWTDRLIAFCADVVQFCFGDDSTNTGSNTGRIGRWKELKEFERLWDLHKPFSFGAIHYKDADRESGEVFPQIWYLAECQVAGMQYLDLACILLTVYDPTIPRLGPGAAAATRRIAEDVRKIVIRLCGIAISNRRSQPALVMASMAITVCGEYFTDRDQQSAMLNLLQDLESEYSWPASRSMRDLKIAWGWD